MPHFVFVSGTYNSSSLPLTIDLMNSVYTTSGKLLCESLRFLEYSMGRERKIYKDTGSTKSSLRKHCDTNRAPLLMHMMLLTKFYFELYRTAGTCRHLGRRFHNTLSILASRHPQDSKSDKTSNMILDESLTLDLSSRAVRGTFRRKTFRRSELECFVDLK